MIINDSIKVKNYKCFGSDEQGFDKIYPINIIIGKNNSGKSSLIELIQFVIDNNEDFMKIGRGNSKTEVLISYIISEQDVRRIFNSQRGGGEIPGNHYEYGKQLIGTRIHYQLLPRNEKNVISFDLDVIPGAKKMASEGLKKINKIFQGKVFRNITAERDIIQEANNGQIDLSPNGTGATNLIQQIINRTKYNSKLIEKELLQEINKITLPEIEFRDIVTQLDESGKWEIFFENNQNDRIALSKMGSGIKTILLVLLNLIVLPKIQNKTKSDFVFAFEELENNLHPSLQRRLYSYIKDYSIKHSTYFFITTHSNIVIDSFGTYENSQIIHVKHNGVTASTKSVLSHIDNKEILKDLDIKASDLLQCNGIIWVEGPSDRIYLKKWLKLSVPELKEGLHYSIMFYGGRLLSNLTFNYEALESELIPLLKINTNSFVIIDRDGKRISNKLNNTKKRIQAEIGENECWITKGREIENYLSENTILNWLESQHSIRLKLKNDLNSKLEDILIRSKRDIKIRYNLNKSAYSKEIVQYITHADLDVLDLKTRVNKIIKSIKNWNNK